MKEVKRTPGPWQTRFIYRMLRRVRESPGDLLIASEPDCDWGDAALIAAAPELLAACEYVLDMLRQTVGDECLADRIGAIGGYRAAELCRVAIAKATGP